jgi:hypothetical protein
MDAITLSLTRVLKQMDTPGWLLRLILRMLRAL